MPFIVSSVAISIISGTVECSANKMNVHMTYVSHRMHAIICIVVDKLTAQNGWKVTKTFIINSLSLLSVHIAISYWLHPFNFWLPQTLHAQMIESMRPLCLWESNANQWNSIDFFLQNTEHFHRLHTIFKI